MNLAWGLAYLFGFFTSLCLGFAFASSTYINNKIASISVAIVIALVTLVFLVAVTWISQSTSPAAKWPLC